MSTSASASNAVLEPSGAASLLEAAAVHSFGLAVFIRVTLLSGARRGELLDLRWPDIRKPDTSGECGFLDITCLDGGKTTYARRRIAIDPGTMALLGKWQSEHAGPDSRGPVFATELSSDRGWNSVWVSRQVGRLAAQAEIQATMHSLRHYSTIRMAKLGVPSWTIRHRLGLASPASHQSFFMPAEAAIAADRDAILLLAREFDQAVGGSASH